MTSANSPSSRRFTVTCLCLTFMTSAYAAESGNGLRTQDVEEAGSDYQVQGEYVGSYEQEGTPEMYGVQVIARGHGAFEAYGLRGGLPGAGWDQSAKIHFRGKTDGEKTTLASTNGKGRLVIRGGRLKIKDASGKLLGRLQKVIRKSPTLGMPPPEGAVVVFDGTTTEHIIAHKEGAPPVTMTKDGFLELTPGQGGLNTKEPFQSSTVHLEFRLPFEPAGRGQERANSGLYLQSRYEVQILDSFGLEGKMEECGGIYSVGPPAVNMCFPPLSWQTYDVEYIAARHDENGALITNPRMTVRHNGVLVHSDQMLKGKTTAAPHSPGLEGRPHHLQEHGHRVLFKNIWVVKH